MNTALSAAEKHLHQKDSETAATQEASEIQLNSTHPDQTAE
jgi:hypothetical protein